MTNIRPMGMRISSMVDSPAYQKMMFKTTVIGNMTTASASGLAYQRKWSSSATRGVSE